MSTPDALRLAQDLDAYHMRAEHKQAAAELRRQHAEIERLRADAARYRALRLQNLSMMPRVSPPFEPHLAYSTPKAMDSAIDAAMRDAL